MRCSEVERDLSAGVGEIHPDDLATHLNGCPRCAAWAESSRALDQLWADTRTTPPGGAAWDASWSLIEAALAAPPAVVTMPRPRSWQPALVAAAAVLFVATGLTVWRGANLSTGPVLADKGGVDSPRNPTPATPAQIEIPVGQTVLINLDGGAMQVVQTNSTGPADLVLGFGGPDEFLNFYGLAEFGFVTGLVASHDPDLSSDSEPEPVPQ
jgi:hypothetical protein